MNKIQQQKYNDMKAELEYEERISLLFNPPYLIKMRRRVENYPTYCKLLNSGKIKKDCICYEDYNY
tara:strand:- start:7744 stop:7941 length:198 start_codon:yes stop_codon:yes gene_type:complete